MKLSEELLEYKLYCCPERDRSTLDGYIERAVEIEEALAYFEKNKCTHGAWPCDISKYIGV